MQFNLSCLYYYTVTVDLTADGLPIPGGYVVPERGDITFICNSSLGGLFWTLNEVSGETVSFSASIGLARQLSQVTTSDTSASANPATITIHNVTSKNNYKSTVVCSSSFKAEINDSATILVEGGDVSTAIHAQS